MNVFLIIGLAGMVLSGFCFNVFADWQNPRADYHSESGEQKKFRTTLGLWSGVIGAVSLLISGAIYYL